MSVKIEIGEEIRRAAPELHIVAIEADVANPSTPDALWDMLEEASADIQKAYPLASVNKRPAINATRKAYKALGKEPNRYRPSAEALCRRIINGKGLYRLTTLVDIINLVSIRSGYSIGGFDASKIEGEVLKLGRGCEGEEFEAIGRGPLNIAGLPVYRDALGGVGTPTSDCERTKLTEATTRLLMVINIYGEEMPEAEVEDLSISLLSKFADARNIEVSRFSVPATY